MMVVAALLGGLVFHAAAAGSSTGQPLWSGLTRRLAGGAGPAAGARAACFACACTWAATRAWWCPACSCFMAWRC
ncbi:MAG: hypothetical protein WKG07_12350 [Hymenobacter sp.]